MADLATAAILDAHVGLGVTRVRQSTAVHASTILCVRELDTESEQIVGLEIQATQNWLIHIKTLNFYIYITVLSLE